MNLQARVFRLVRASQNEQMNHTEPYLNFAKSHSFFCPCTKNVLPTTRPKDIVLLIKAT